MLNLILTNAGLLGLFALAAHGAGWIAIPRLPEVSRLELRVLRMVAGLAVLGTCAFLLGLAGALRAGPLAALLAVAAGAGVWATWKEPSAATTGRAGTDRSALWIGAVVGAVSFAALFALALYPPTAFDETLYHLPMVRRFAETGELPFIAELRMPVAPQLDEVLRVPLYLFGSDVATHQLALLATLLTGAVVWVAARRSAGDRAAWFAAALTLSSPLVVMLATTGYVEALLALFAVSGLHAFERWSQAGSRGWLVAAGLFAGAAAAVKLLGLFWLGLLGLGILWLGVRRGEPGLARRLRPLLLYALVASAVALPWYARVVWHTGNPLFPFGAEVFGHSAWAHHPIRSIALGVGIVDLARFPWDTYFDRGRLGYLPPISPWLVLMIPAVALALRSDRQTRWLLVPAILWALVWSVVLPRDPRYLAPVLPLAALAAARTLLAWPLVAGRSVASAALLAASLLLPGPLYAAYRMQRLGPLPTVPAAREAFLVRNVPGYGGIATLNRISRDEDRAYVCLGEWLHYHYRGQMVGDQSGPGRYARLAELRSPDELAALLAELAVRYFATIEPGCVVPPLHAAVQAGVLRHVETVPDLTLPPLGPGAGRNGDEPRTGRMEIYEVSGVSFERQWPAAGGTQPAQTRN